MNERYNQYLRVDKTALAGRQTKLKHCNKIMWTDERSLTDNANKFRFRQWLFKETQLI